MPRVKAGIDRTGVPETSHAQGSADEEHCACSDFTDDEQAAQSGLAQTGWLSFVLKIRSHRGRRAAEGRRQAKCDTADQRASTSICWISRLRAAPKAERTAISRVRPVARASRKLATFAHAIRRTNPNTAMSNAVNALT